MFQPNDRKDYSLSTFVALNGVDFVSGCYGGLLGRAPDGKGLGHYLDLLRRGASKVDIVGRIRFSAEGRHYGARVHGLLLPFVFHTMVRVPVVGYVLDFLVTLFTLPLLKRRLRRFEDAAFTEETWKADAPHDLEQRLEAVDANQREPGNRA